MMHSPSRANRINMFSTVEPVVSTCSPTKVFLSTCSPTKAVFQPGFNHPKQYKGEMRHMCHLYNSIPLSMGTGSAYIFVYKIASILIDLNQILEREREIFIQPQIRNTFKIYKLDTKHSCAHSSQKILLWSTQNKNKSMLFYRKTYELLYR